MANSKSSANTLINNGLGYFAKGAGDDIFSPSWENLYLTQPSPLFISLVDAVIAAPPLPIIAAGENGATASQSNLFWAYVPNVGLTVETNPGFMTTNTGNGGFNLFVGADGSWVLKFDGSNKVISSADNTPVPPPPAGNAVINVPGTGPASVNAGAGHLTVNGGAGYDTISGGVGDYMIGGSGTLGGGLAGDGNCAVYTSSTGSILVDMQNGFGYGGAADGDVYVNMNQVRGTYQSNVLIGNSNGTDLKSGGDNSVLISTGGNGFELRPDGSGNVLVSTVGADRLVFDPGHGWMLGDDNIELGFNTAHGDTIDLSVLLGGGAIKLLGGGTVTSNFFSTSAAGYDPRTGMGNINNYINIKDEADGSHVMFSATGNVKTAGTELVDLKFVHGLNVQTMLQDHNILV